jgi:hypothetical protein
MRWCLSKLNTNTYDIIKIHEDVMYQSSRFTFAVNEDQRDKFQNYLNNSQFFVS